MKKALFVLIFPAVIFLFLMLPADCYAADAYIYADAALIDGANILAVELFVDRALPLCALELEISASPLSPSSCTRGDALSGIRYACRLTPETAHLVFLSAESFSADGHLATVCFGIPDGISVQDIRLSIRCSAVSLSDGRLIYANVGIFLPAPEQEDCTAEEQTESEQTERNPDGGSSYESESYPTDSDLTQGSPTDSEPICNSDTGCGRPETERENSEPVESEPPACADSNSSNNIPSKDSMRAKMVYLLPLALLTALYILSLLPYTLRDIFCRRIF